MGARQDGAAARWSDGFFRLRPLCNREAGGREARRGELSCRSVPFAFYGNAVCRRHLWTRHVPYIVN
ncbi:hypothetical protein [Devosia sp. DBB001]|nr:hypothetical protein [Devosia sp. DBB001]